VFNRIWRAFRNDASLYAELKGNPQFASESWLIFAISIVISAILVSLLDGNQLVPGIIGGLALVSALSSILGFFALVILAWSIGAKLAGGTGSFTDIRAAMAYAYCIPAILTPIPTVGLIASLWFLVTGSSAIRETLGIGKGLTFIIVIISGMVIFAIQFIAFAALMSMGTN
jgi:hypothetical protein